MCASMTNLPKLDVLLPARNEERYIEPCLRAVNSVLEASRSQARIVLIDDKSTDQTVSIAKEISDQFTNLELEVVTATLMNKSSRLAAVLNQGLPFIYSPIFLRLDADMAITGDVLHLYQMIDRDQTIGAIGGRMPNLPSNIVNETLNLTQGNYLRSNGFFRTELVKQIGYHTIAEDTFLYAKIRELGYRTVFINRIVAYHLREHTVEYFKRKWKSFTLANLQLGFPRWYPFARLGRAMLRCITQRNARALLLCSLAIDSVRRGLQEYHPEMQEQINIPPFQNKGQFSLLKYLRRRK